ncbi:MAG: bifunctional 2-polyprenyl-6-hydroxyphenol methylase/3-demethylubiquinol 3-O-methyltransferase UbiG [Alphaproteobacteria bacterium]
MKTKLFNKEHDLFKSLSEEWWDENGKFKILHKIRPIRIKYILDQINEKKLKNLDILDLGCGGGLVSESLSRLGANVTGIDFVKNNIEVAKEHSNKKKLKINYKYANIETLKIKNKYDLIIMYEILEHLDDWESFLLNISKNLKSTGIIVISTINRNALSKFAAIYLAENILGWIPKGTHTYKKFIKPQEITNSMESKNFILKNLKGLIFDPIMMDWKLSNNTSINYFCSYHKSN